MSTTVQRPAAVASNPGSTGIGSPSWRGSWRVALRLARRDALRSKGRTALVAIMVGVPVMLIVALSTLYHTNDVSPRESLTSQLGQAQAWVMPSGDAREAVTQSPLAEGWSTGATTGPPSAGSVDAGAPTAQPASRPWTTAELAQVTRGRVLQLWNGSTRLSSGTAALPVSAIERPLADPAARGMVRLVSGRLPTATSEIAVTRGLASKAGWVAGTRLQDLDTNTSVTVVGVYSLLAMSNQDRGVLGVPNTFHAPADGEASQSTFLVVRDQPIGWAEVQRLNQAGLVVFSRAVVLDPPARSSLDNEQQRISNGDPATRAVVVMVVVAIVIEVVLLAGPAFAVGVRRRRRDLALLAATGSTPRDIRRAVLAQAALIGVGAATAGALLGLPLAGFAMPVVEHFGPGLGPFDWRWTELLVALAVGAAAAVIAAWAPAVQAARSDVATVLAGRRGVLRSRRGWPLLGVVLVAAGSVATLTRGTKAGGEIWVSAGTIVIVLGAVAATPWLVGQVGRLATRLPLPLRLATRDAARQRARTAPAVAAIMASVIGITALAIGFASDTKQGRRDYEPRTAYGLATVGIPGAENLQAVEDTIRTVLPGRPITVSYSADALPPSADNTSVDHSKDRMVTFAIATPGCTLPQASGLVSNGSDSCGGRWQQVNSNTSVVADGAAELKAFGAQLDQHALSVLAGGGMLVAAPDALSGDRALVGVVSAAPDGTDLRVDQQLTVPVAPLPASAPRTARVAAVAMSPETATRLGLTRTPTQIAIGGAMLSKDEEDRLNGKLGLIDSGVYVERGYQQPYGLILALLALVGSLVVLVATITATGLAMSEAKPDLATLAAVGAPPRTRRYVAAAQAVVIGLIGTALGVALGFVPGLAVTWPLTAHSYSSYEPPAGGADGPVIAIPWLMLLIVVVAVPLVAGLVTGLCTRSRLPMVRRLAT